ncbi:nuclear transport factor 2 family protein [Formosa sp. PL04]|uniref:nuclear transport factor 2 family protein n=1 Tax=Formosa sp. PL04 TaxID=3081755 RepID=UPI0029820B5C|nr:nuclear transport factor 2 family protein [Formosa sp. PL04]MDW5290576.1 nuclear transport factor 2 family protein [Formosa sp. PL04]
MATEQNIQTINALYNGFSTGDMPTVLGLMDPKIEWNEAESNSLADSNPYIGPQAILEGVFARLGANHEHFGLQDVKNHGMQDNMILATMRYDAKVKETGKTYNAQVAHLWTLNDEAKIIAFQQYADTKKIADAEQ